MVLRRRRRQDAQPVQDVDVAEAVTVRMEDGPKVGLPPVASASWRTFEEVADVFAGRADAGCRGPRPARQRCRRPVGAVAALVTRKSFRTAYEAWYALAFPDGSSSSDEIDELHADLVLYDSWVADTVIPC